jgi:organic hydroperoxide reductase OsmC/OhrA
VSGLACDNRRSEVERNPMQDFPHRYDVVATANMSGDVALDSTHLATLRSDSPEAFGGPGNRWSPETLLVAALGDCFVLTFRAMAQASKIDWIRLECQVIGVLDRIDRVVAFTEFDLRVRLLVPPDANVPRVRGLLEKAERGCLVSNSLKATICLEAQIEVVEEKAEAAPIW